MASFSANKDGRQVLEFSAADGSSVVVYQQGGHLASWRGADGDEYLYLSPKAVFEDGKALRGGVPIIFPQFSKMGPMKTHGFARVRNWDLKSADPAKGEVVLTLPVRPDDPELPGHNLLLTYTITFSSTELSLSMAVVNNRTDLPFEFTFAFHSYFPVTDISSTLVNGVNLTPYIDNLKDMKKQPAEMLIKIDKEVDRIYLNQTCAVMLQDTAAKRAIHVSGVNLNDVVLWNPWVEKTLTMSDMPEDGYKHFICIEHAAVEPKAKVLPQGVWKGEQRVAIYKSLNSKV